MCSVFKEGNGQLGISRRRWENETKIDLKETGYGSVNWIYLAQASVY
jgi:hypothetical protein